MLHSRGASMSALPATAGFGWTLPTPTHYSPARTQYSSPHVQYSPQIQPLYSSTQVGFPAYSPSRVKPINQDFLARLLANSTDQPAGPDPVLPPFPRNTSAPRHALSRIADVSSPIRPSLASDNRRGFIVNGVPINSTHWSVLEQFLVSCNAKFIIH